jgi:signal transduction histidine kinase/ligand-binding sensor domain-containing protein
VRRLFQILLAMAASALALAGPAPSAEATTWSIRHYQHTTFTQKDGAPLPNGVAIAQTSDGYLWTDGIKGLSRFDGLRFQTFVPRSGEQLLSDEVSLMFGPKTGGLWVAYEVPGISFIKNGHITNYRTNDGWPGGTAEFFEDRNGAVLAFAFPGVMKLVHGQWMRIDEEPTGANIVEVTQDQAFNLWALDAEGNVMELPEGGRSFKKAGLKYPDAFRITAIGNGYLFVFTRGSKIHRLRVTSSGAAEAGDPIPLYGQRIVMDPHRNLWIGTPDQGIHFLGTGDSLPASAKPFPTGTTINTDNGLTGNFASPIVDHDGNVWVATEGGLDRFSPSAFSKLDLPRGINELTLSPGDNGSMWIGSEAHNVIHYVNDAPEDTSAPRAAMSMHTNLLTHEVLAATAEELWHLAPGSPRALTKLPAADIGVVRSMAQDAAGNPWIAYASQTAEIAQFRDGSWLTPTCPPGGRSLYADGSDVWVGYEDNRAAVYHEGTWTTYGSEHGIAAGFVKVFARNQGSLWIGGDQGVQAFDGTRFRSLKLVGGRSLTDVSGLVFDRRGDLWVHSLDGLYWFSADAVGHFLSGKDITSTFRRFDSDDGLPGVPAQTHTLPSLVQASDGRLWLSGQNAAAWLDPDDIPPVRAPSLPVVERISDGTQDFDLASANLRLPPKARNLVITYAAPDLTDAQRVRYQYRLTGFDDHWQDAGIRREAVYQHLTSGAYQFEVRSSKDGQSWEVEASKLSFFISPTFAETWLAKMLAIVTVGLAVALLVQLRVRAVTRSVRRQMQIRADEREAVARDIHDTLLQHAQGLAFQLEALSKEADNPELSARVSKLSSMARQAAIEGRDKVSLLRSSVGDHRDPLNEMLSQATEAAAQSGIVFRFETTGSPYPFKPEVMEDLVPMLRELLRNAFQHSGARTVSLTMQFRPWRYLATVCDDGIGLTKDVLAGIGPKGHWGLSGVRERATRMGGRIEFLSVEKGTCIRFKARRHRLKGAS